MKIGVITFPGSNCDQDMRKSLVGMGHEVSMVWHQDSQLPKLDAVVLPGGFSYGDYLRSGAIARFSPIMESVGKFASAGGFVLGICNGFQILTEAGLLPGALLRNQTPRFVCKDVFITPSSDAHNRYGYYQDQVFRIPIAHGEGNYYCSTETLSEIQQNGQIIFTYCGPHNEKNAEWNPNGSLADIAGVCNLKGNVLGMMPHPERVSDPRMGCVDGIAVLQTFLSKVN
ncbi:MAG: phosphoribosylformylglycinamidine synthase subunit PurQ [Sphingobacteriia bacterium]|nr:phosphoribosylformylglycinamidine synthase subunit PurQ [Sphingobacteriia bacterium]